MAGFRNEVMYGSNVDFSGAAIASPTMVSNGQLLIGSGVSPNIRVGSLTSSGGTIGITNGPGTINLENISPYYSLTPYIVGPDAHSQFFQIQDAINQAVADGMSSANPKNIYVKPATYNGFTVADGMNLIGLVDQTVSVSSSTYGPSVFISTAVTHAFGNVSFQGISFIPPAGSAYHMESGEANFSGCYSNISAASFFSFTGTGSKVVYLSQCVIAGSGTSSLAICDGSNMSIFINAFGSQIAYPGVTTFTGSGSNVLLSMSSGFLLMSFVFNVGGFNYDMRSMVQVAGVAPNTHITSGANVTSGNVTALDTGISAGSTALFFDFTLGSGCVYTISQCNVNSNIPDFFIQSAANNKIGGALYFVGGAGIDQQDHRLVFNCGNIGWRGSYWNMQQSMIQTTSTSPAILIPIPVPSGVTVTVSGTLTAANPGHSDITGGDFSFTADGTLGAIVGTPSKNVFATSSGDFSISFSGGMALLEVTAPSSSAYNWSSSYSYQQLLTDQ